MPWSSRSTMSLRHEFVTLALLDGANMQALCERFSISRQTGYKWLDRYRREGSAGLADRSRRPHSSPKRTGENMERAVLAVRDDHTAWGGRKIRNTLAGEHAGPYIVAGTPGEHIPASSTITAILSRNGRLDPTECAKHQPCQHFEYPHPNALWQMDFKGNFGLAGGGRCHPLTVLDDHSRFCVLLSACSNEQAVTVEAQLQCCFREYGLPERNLCDNGPPWGGAGAGRVSGTRMTDGQNPGFASCH